jgi:hypothetical protein
MAVDPKYGYVEGHAVYARTSHYIPGLLRLGPAQLKHDLAIADSFNSKVAVLLTRVVGTMWCFWVFNVIALPALVAAFKTGSVLPIINAVSSNWIQLILLPALMVGQNLQNVAADARSAKTFDDIEHVKSDVAVALDRLDTHTDGGLKEVLDAIRALPGGAR